MGVEREALSGQDLDPLLFSTRDTLLLFTGNSGPCLKILLSAVFWVTHANQLELARNETGLPSH